VAFGYRGQSMAQASIMDWQVKTKGGFGGLVPFTLGLASWFGVREGQGNFLEGRQQNREGLLRGFLWRDGKACPPLRWHLSETKDSSTLALHGKRISWCSLLHAFDEQGNLKAKQNTKGLKITDEVHSSTVGI